MIIATEPTILIVPNSILYTKTISQNLVNVDCCHRSRLLAVKPGLPKHRKERSIELSQTTPITPNQIFFFFFFFLYI